LKASGTTGLAPHSNNGAAYAKTWIMSLDLPGETNMPSLHAMWQLWAFSVQKCS